MFVNSFSFYDTDCAIVNEDTVPDEKGDPSISIKEWLIKSQEQRNYETSKKGSVSVCDVNCS